MISQAAQGATGKSFAGIALMLVLLLFILSSGETWSMKKWFGALPTFGDRRKGLRIAHDIRTRSLALSPHHISNQYRAWHHHRKPPCHCRHAQPGFMGHCCGDTEFRAASGRCCRHRHRWYGRAGFHADHHRRPAALGNLSRLHHA